MGYRISQTVLTHHWTETSTEQLLRSNSPNSFHNRSGSEHKIMGLTCSGKPVSLQFHMLPSSFRNLSTSSVFNTWLCSIHQPILYRPPVNTAQATHNFSLLLPLLSTLILSLHYYYCQIKQKCSKRLDY